MTRKGVKKPQLERVMCLRYNCSGMVYYHEKTGKYSCDVCCRIYSREDVAYLSGVRAKDLKWATVW
jgi:hypothetical protein